MSLPWRITQELHGVDARTCVRMLRERKGVRWEETPPFFRYGTFVKKEAYEKPAFNPKTKQAVVARRTRLDSRSFAYRDDEAESFLLAKLWTGQGPGSGVECAEVRQADDAEHLE